ncbi:MAG: uroporphyrinogen decarboxylase family protein, partial [Dehalococcoidia bacterium]|nr:uroporphyrinogen decarboxylase family protein [Dehalococcoidia bacterium]
MPEMTPRERIEAAIALRKPDRVPTAPLILQFAGRYGGITGEEYLFDIDKAEGAVEQTFDGLGGWDAWPIFNPIQGQALTMRPIKYRFPGRELPLDSSYQVVEEPYMTIEDYDVIANEGYPVFFKRLHQKVYPEYKAEELGPLRIRLREAQLRNIKKWAERGIPTIAGAMIQVPIDDLIQYRSMKELATDLFRRPEKVLKAIELMTPIIAETGRRGAQGSGAMGVWLGGLRSNSSFLSPKQFEKFVLPSLVTIVHSLAEAGLLVYLHFDQDWTANLPYLKELPKGKCILATDGTTDMVRAKEILGDHMCLMGDVPSTLLSIGTPLEVEQYCRERIEVVGAGGGYILSSGCELPIDAKPENVKAMLESVEKYG